MTKPISTSNATMREVKALRAKLAEAENKLAEAQEVIHAIQSGDVDAVVVSGPQGEQVFTLRSAEYAYRVLVEAMNEGAATLSADGIVLYCNQRLSDCVGIPVEQIIGSPAVKFVAAEAKHVFEALFARARTGEPCKAELDFQAGQSKCPVYVSLRGMKADEPAALSMVVTDLTEHRKRDELIAAGALATSILASAAEAIAVCDETGKIITVNEALENLCGFNPFFQQFDSALPLEVSGDTGAPVQQFSISAALAGVVHRALEVSFRRKDGQIFTLLLSSGRIAGLSGVVGCVLTLTDITYRKRAEEALRRSQAQLVHAQSLSHTGSWSLNVTTGQLSWSEEHFRITGLDPQMGIPPYPTVLQVLHPEDRSFVQRALEAAIRDRSTFEVWCRIVRPDGTIRDIHSLGEPRFDRWGALTYFDGTIIDVTESKRAEEKLRASEGRFRQLIESIPHHVWSVRSDGSVGYWNQRLIDYTGLTQEEVRQGRWDTLHPDDLARAKAAWQEAWAKGTNFEVEQRLRARDGSYRRFVCRGMPVKDGEGQIVEWFGTDTDVEDRRQTQEALIKSHAELAHATRVVALGELTASIAHEINQPLGAIVSNGDACLRLLSHAEPEKSAIREAVDCMVADAVRASEVIKHIRALLKKTAIDQVPVYINEIIREVIVFTARELVSNQVALRTELGEALPLVRGDRVQLQQVVLNLILNANDAMRGKRVRKRELLLTSRSSNRHELLVTVRDTGAGIAPGDLGHIFEPFFTTKTGKGGLGLGLSISRSIVEAHGGQLWATPNEDGGATFSFTLSASQDGSHAGTKPGRVCGRR